MSSSVRNDAPCLSASSTTPAPLPLVAGSMKPLEGCPTGRNRSGIEPLRARSSHACNEGQRGAPADADAATSPLDDDAIMYAVWMLDIVGGQEQ